MLNYQRVPQMKWDVYDDPHGQLMLLGWFVIGFTKRYLYIVISIINHSFHVFYYI